MDHKHKNTARRGLPLSVAALVAGLTIAVVGRATQTFVVPNAATYTFSLAAGATSTPITPVANQPVFLMGTTTTSGDRGVASATILHVPSSFIEWVGLESTAGSAITQGFNSGAGVHVLYLDFSHLVDVQIASADTIYVHNAAAFANTGSLELIW